MPWHSNVLREGKAMHSHNLFYYPYASLTNDQLPLLKVAALYFDKLVILDPVDASWSMVGADHVARGAIALLKDAGMLEVVMPADVLAKYAGPLTEAVRRDMADREFLDLCDAHTVATGKQRWTLALAKVPQDMHVDQAMRYLMGDFARDVAKKAAYAANDYVEHIEALSSLPGNDQPVPSGLIERANNYREYAEVGQAYDEYREGYGGGVEYRYADFPLALGEAIMMNHALFAGLLHAGATPITDDSFHSRALAHKLQRATQEPAIRQVVADRAAQRQLKAGALAAAALTDTQIQLPILNPAIPLVEVLEYRQRHPEALAKVRDTLGLMARRIQAEPWTADFEREIETKTLPDLIEQLNQATKSRDAWLGSQQTKQWLKAAGIAVGAASAVLAVVTAPVTPIALAAAGLTLASGTAIPGAEWLLDWRDGKKGVQENGLHYLLKA